MDVSFTCIVNWKLMTWPMYKFSFLGSWTKGFHSCLWAPFHKVNSKYKYSSMEPSIMQTKTFYSMNLWVAKTKKPHVEEACCFEMQKSINLTFYRFIPFQFMGDMLVYRNTGLSGSLKRCSCSVAVYIAIFDFKMSKCDICEMVVTTTLKRASLRLCFKQNFENSSMQGP